MEIAAELGCDVMVKVQVPHGGRGKLGGVRHANTPSDAAAIADELLGEKLRDAWIECVLVEERLPIVDELYLAVTTDTRLAVPVLLASTLGGTEVESQANIAREVVDIAHGLRDGQSEEFLASAGLALTYRGEAAHWLEKLYQLYRECDAQLVEVNPLAVLDDERLVAADAHIVVDDNALFRQPEIAHWRERSAFERIADCAGINYVALDGDIGIMGTGAGMAMVNVDQVVHFGGRPANFMDVGPTMGSGGPRAGMDILLARHDLRAILISGYSGGQLDCMARDIVDALAAHPLVSIPIVVRLQGRNEDDVKRILHACTYPQLHIANDFDEAAKLVCSLAGG
ncbi:MAG: hypothetical protein LC737_10760, partial [Chloroflexi bacterium]|nr:hypothetical protein [Chloroflexota bacterium]